FIPILLQQLYHGPKAQLPGMIGATLTAAGIAMAITTPLWGRLGDGIGRWRVLPLCLAAMALGMGAEGLASSLGMLQGSIFVVGLFQGAIGTTVVALLAILTPESRRASILNYSLLPAQFSFFLGPIMGTGLAVISLRAPFMAGALLESGACALALLLALRLGSLLAQSQPTPTDAVAIETVEAESETPTAV
ncbi:MAG: MFS transporter, partial [Ktedonobacterales bacterium]